MTLQKIRDSLENFEKALQRLEEALKHPKTDPLILDGTLQRFEFVFEICWKTLKRALVFEGIEANTPREVLTKCYQVGWIHQESLWLEMLNDRNLSSHVYDQASAEEIYEHVKIYVSDLRNLFDFLRKKYPVS